MYMPTPEILLAVRNRIAEKHSEFPQDRSSEGAA